MSVDNTSDPAKAKVASGNGPTAAEYRLAQQKAALKANMARRKAQARALAQQGADGDLFVPDQVPGSDNKDKE